MAILPAPKHPLKILEGLKVDVKKSIHEMRKEALEAAQKLVDKKT